VLSILRERIRRQLYSGLRQTKLQQSHLIQCGIWTLKVRLQSAVVIAGVLLKGPGGENRNETSRAEKRPYDEDRSTGGTHGRNNCKSGPGIDRWNCE
jgi:hypothetical protein